MPDTAEIIVELLRKALNKDYCINTKYFKDANWDDVINLSMVQEVSAMVFDGIEGLPEDCRPDREALLNWFGRTSYQERQYDQSWEVANQLAEFWQANGIYAVILKGRSIAQYYPKPNHRYSCDLDIFIQNANDWEKACKLLKSKGISLNHKIYKEVEFTFNGVYVECHRYITPLRGNKTLIQFEKYLRFLLKHDTSGRFPCSILIVPPLMFSALLFIEHALGDMLKGKLSMKHVVDWIVLRKQNIDWDIFDGRCKEFGFERFVLLINALADTVEAKITYSALVSEHQHIYQELFQERKTGKRQCSLFERHVALFFEFIRNRKNYTRYGYCTMYQHLFSSVWTHFVNKAVDI